MFNLNKSRGFTLIEMLVALVVGGLLMASLVALSGSVQRSFGRSKEITDLQNDLRYGVKMLGEDIARAGLMHSPNPAIDFKSVSVGTGGVSQVELANFQAIRWNTPILDLYGNYVSARDYLWNRNTKEICCRNGVRPSEPEYGTCDEPGQYFDRYLMPYADGPGLVDYVFCPGLLVRVETAENKHAYHRVAGINAAPANTVTFSVSADVVEKENLWISPVNHVQYEMVQDGAFVPRFTSPTPAAQRWQLVRRIESCRAGVLTFIDNLFLAEYLLPPNGPRPGLVMSAYLDTGYILGVPSSPVSLSTPPAPPDQFVPNTGFVFQPQQMRGVLVTLRGRSHTEDPEFTIPGYAGNEAQANRFGVDLDGDPDSGLAHVREMTTLVEIPNLSLGPS